MIGLEVWSTELGLITRRLFTLAQADAFSDLSSRGLLAALFTSSGRIADSGKLWITRDDLSFLWFDVEEG